MYFETVAWILASWKAKHTAEWSLMSLVLTLAYLTPGMTIVMPGFGCSCTLVHMVVAARPVATAMMQMGLAISEESPVCLHLLVQPACCCQESMPPFMPRLTQLRGAIAEHLASECSSLCS